MRIELINESLKVKKGNYLSDIVMRIFSICKEDPTFPLRQKIEDVDLKIDDLKDRIQKQDSLIEQAAQLKESCNKRIINIEKGNFDIQIELLDKLGSEL
jgi:phosphoenolpyruvate carboxylase